MRSFTFLKCEIPAKIPESENRLPRGFEGKKAGQFRQKFRNCLFLSVESTEFRNFCRNSAAKMASKPYAAGVCPSGIFAGIRGFDDDESDPIPPRPNRETRSRLPPFPVDRGTGVDSRNQGGQYHAASQPQAGSTAPEQIDTNSYHMAQPHHLSASYPRPNLRSVTGLYGSRRRLLRRLSGVPSPRSFLWTQRPPCGPM